jgi:hypothetical protein
MRLLFGTVIAVWFLTALASAVQAGSVYLRDGGIVDCESFWRKGDQVIVKVNRDVVVEFGSDEIDLKRTLRAKKLKSGRHIQPQATTVRHAGSPAATAAPAGTGEMAGKPATVGQAGSAGEKQLTPAATGKEPATVQAAPAPPQPPAPVVAEPPQPVPVITPPAMPQTAMSSTMMSLFVGGALAFVLLMIAGQWKLFEKAGVAGWKCLIPIYNMYLLFLIAGKPGWWLILMLIPLVSIVVYLLAMLSLAGRFSKGPVYGVGLFLLPFIFFPLLAFDGSEYSG